MRYYATSLAEHNIRVNTVHPSGMASPMLLNEPIEQYIAKNPDVLPTLANLLPVELCRARRQQ